MSKIAVAKISELFDLFLPSRGDIDNKNTQNDSRYLAKVAASVFDREGLSFMILFAVGGRSEWFEVSPFEWFDGLRPV